MNINKTSLSTAVAALALGSISLTACGSGDNSASKAPNVSNSATATASKAAPSPSSTEKKVSRDEHRSPLASPSSTTSKAPATAKIETPKPAPKATSTHKAAPKANTAPSPVVTQKSWSSTESLAQPHAVYVNDSSMAKGSSKVISQGHPGSTKVQYTRTLVNGVPGAAKVVSSNVISSPKATRIAVGTYVAPQKKAVARTYAAPKVVKKATTQTTTKKATAAATRSTAAPAAANEGMWDKIAQCESGGNWHIRSGNGYYGGVQFNHDAWAEYGGHAYAPEADLATKAQQIAIANKLYAARGLQPWQCGWAAYR